MILLEYETRQSDVIEKQHIKMVILKYTYKVIQSYVIEIWVEIDCACGAAISESWYCLEICRSQMSQTDLAFLL